MGDVIGDSRRLWADTRPRRLWSEPVLHLQGSSPVTFTVEKFPKIALSGSFCANFSTVNERGGQPSHFYRLAARGQPAFGA